MDVDDVAAQHIELHGKLHHQEGDTDKDADIEGKHHQPAAVEHDVEAAHGKLHRKERQPEYPERKERESALAPPARLRGGRWGDPGTVAATPLPRPFAAPGSGGSVR
ncbi:hypothetical protein D3C84_975950 [compost metagenome]